MEPPSRHPALHTTTHAKLVQLTTKFHSLEANLSPWGPYAHYLSGTKLHTIALAAPD